MEQLAGRSCKQSVLQVIRTSLDSVMAKEHMGTTTTRDHPQQSCKDVWGMCGHLSLRGMATIDQHLMVELAVVFEQR